MTMQVIADEHDKVNSAGEGSGVQCFRQPRMHMHAFPAARKPAGFAPRPGKTMLLTEYLALGAGGACAAFAIYLATRPAVEQALNWWVPALSAAAFLAFTAWTGFTEGPLGFWPEHSARKWWGNQIWFDLLLMFSMAWFLVLPRARAQEMKVLPWMVLALSTGSIGFLAMVARLLYLEQRAGRTLR